MDQNTLLTVMTEFVAIAGVAMIVQMAVMIGRYNREGIASAVKAGKQAYRNAVTGVD